MIVIPKKVRCVAIAQDCGTDLTVGKIYNVDSCEVNKLNECMAYIYDDVGDYINILLDRDCAFGKWEVVE